MRYSAYEYEDLVANFHERGAGRMWHVANYFDFARQIATDAWMLNPEVITSNHELSWLSALFMWASPIEDQYIFQRHYSAHQIINERIPLSRGEIDALVDHGFGRFLAFDNAALCGYYSYEQDLIVGFFHRALAAMDFDETLSNGDRDWCKQQQYRNVDYENFPDIQDGDFIMWTATDFMLEFQFQMDDECNIMDYDEVYGTVVPPSSWWWHPEGSIMALGEPDQFRFTMPADIIQCALGDEDDHIELNKAPVKIHNQNCDDDYWGTYCTNEHQIVLYWDEDMDDHFGESGEYPTISYHVEMHDGPMDEDGVLSDDGWYTHRSNWRQLGIKIREGIVPNHVYHIRVTREISSAATYGDDSWNTHQGFAVTTARIPQAVYNLRVVETDESEEPLRMHNSTDIDRISVQWDTPYSGGSDIIMYYVSVVRPATSNDYDKVRSEVPDMWDYDSISWSTDNSELVWF